MNCAVEFSCLHISMSDRSAKSNSNNGSRNNSTKNGSSKNGNSKNGTSKNGNTKNSSSKSDRSQIDKNLSMRDRIKAFEASEDEATAVEVKMREGHKPRKKKPTSKAFEEFETSGILIGFGNAPKRRISEELEDSGGDPISQSESAELDAFPLPGLADEVQSQLPKRTNSRISTDDEGIHTMDSGEEDEFAAVTRNSELLKSFRRAPPPKNRTRARRSTRKRGQLHSDPFQDIPGLESPLEDNEYRWRSDDKSSYTSSRDNISEGNTISSLKTSCDSFNLVDDAGDEGGEPEEPPKNVKIYRPIEKPCTENIRRSLDHPVTMATGSPVSMTTDSSVSEEEHKSVSQTVREFSHHHLMSPTRGGAGGRGFQASPPGGKGPTPRALLTGSQGDISPASSSASSPHRPASFCYMKVSGSRTSDSLCAGLGRGDEVTRSSPSTPRREGGTGGPGELRRWDSEHSGLPSSVSQRKAVISRLEATIAERQQAPGQSPRQRPVSYITTGEADVDEDNRTNSIRKMGKTVFNDRIRQWDSFSSTGPCPNPVVKHVERRPSNVMPEINGQQSNMQTCWSEYKPSGLTHSPRQAPMIKFIIDKEPTQV